jgi:hypothetical protein
MSYRDKIETKAHDFAGTTTEVKSATLGSHVIEGLNRLRVEPKVDRNQTNSAADGFAWDEKMASREGTIMIEVPENSPSNTFLWDLYEADDAFTFSHADPASSKLKINNTGARINRPPIERGGSVNMIEYTLTVKYLDYRGGGYDLVQIPV